MTVSFANWGFICLFYLFQIVFEILTGEARPPARNDGEPARPPNEHHVCLWRHCAFVDYGTAARNHNMPELCFALFIKPLIAQLLWKKNGAH